MSRRAHVRGIATSHSGHALAGTVLGNAPGFVLPFAIAAVHRIGALTDAYFFAFAVAMFVAAIANVAVESNMVPVGHRARQAGRANVLRDAARRAVQVAVVAGGIYAVIAAVAAALAPSMRDEATHVLRASLGWFGLYAAATAGASVLTAFLYAHDRFFLPPATGGLRAWAGLAALIAFPTGAGGLIAVAAAYAVGEVVRLALLAGSLWRQASGAPDVGATAGPVWNPLLHHALSMCVVGAVPIIDRSFAAHVGPGSVTVIELAEKLIFVPVLILTSSITVVAGNRWAASHTRGADPRVDAGRVMRRLAIASTVAASLLTLAAGATALLVPEVLGVPSTTLAWVVAAMATGLPTGVLINASTRYLTATGDTTLLPRFAAWTLIGNTVLDAVLVTAIGLAGIAIATSLTRIVSLAFYLRHIFRQQQPLADGVASPVSSG